MITPEQIKVDITDDGQAVNPIHCRSRIAVGLGLEIARVKLSNDLNVRSQQLQQADLQLRFGTMKVIYGECWQVGVDMARRLAELQAGLTLTEEQKKEFEQMQAACRWLAKTGFGSPPANGVEAPRIVRPR